MLQFALLTLVFAWAISLARLVKTWGEPAPAAVTRRPRRRRTV
jgi:hypothetical protein